MNSGDLIALRAVRAIAILLIIGLVTYAYRSGALSPGPRVVALPD